MEPIKASLLFLSAFTLISLASNQVGEFFSRLRLPKITGYLLTGIIAGHFVLDFLTEDLVHSLLFIDEFSLAFIAFAAGNELYLPEVKGLFKSIGWVTTGLVTTTLILVSLVVFFLSRSIPFMQDMTLNGRIATALMAGAILVARSPSSAIAIVNELRAKGPYTQVILGVTVVMDVVVIILFALSASVGEAFLRQAGIDFSFIFILLGELLLALLVGFFLYKLLDALLATRLGRLLKIIIILLSGFAVFTLSHIFRDATHELLGLELFVEPLLVCVVASFLLNNYGRNRLEFSSLLHDTGPFIFVAFFTLTGAALELDLLALIWPIALILFGVRLLSVMIGSFVGGTIAGDSMKHNRYKWMGFVTQAGVALGLAKETAVEFPELGNSFATLIIAVVALNEIVGPLFFKFAINRVGEAHTRHETPAFDGVRDAIIFGYESQSLALANQLRLHGWEVKVACYTGHYRSFMEKSDVEVSEIVDFTAETLQSLGAERAEAIIAMLSDEENLSISETAFEHFGTKNLIVRLNDRANFEKFHELGALIVDPSTAIVSLLDHFVRSPSATSLLLGMEEGQDVVELTIGNRRLDGVALRDLRLPASTLILSLQRDGHMIISHGFTRLKLGDVITAVGEKGDLDRLALRVE
jgi:Trk K+ transport system NAD-binding subunit/Kef-type K+ transport system membrane component KefB